MDFPSCFGRFPKCEREYCEVAEICQEASDELEDLPDCYGDYDWMDEKCEYCPYADDCKIESEQIEEDLELYDP